MEKVTPKDRIEYIDFMNIAACFAVVCLHCSGSVFEYGIIEDRQWFLNMFVQTIAHFAVPVFFMITGTTLLEYRKKYTTRVFFKKRFLRTGIPFLFWSCFYLLLPVVLEGAAFPIAEAWLNAIFNNGANNVFWFFYTIWGIYLSMPILSLLAKEENFKCVEYICILSFAVSAVYPLITRFVMPVDGGIIPTFVTGYVGYVFAGWLILHEQYSKKVRQFIYILGVCGALLMFFGTYYLSSLAGTTDTFFMDYLSVACFPMSISIMLLAKHINWQKVYRIVPWKWISKVSGAGLGVYILHMLFLILLQRFPIALLEEHPMYFVVFMPIGIYLVSLGLVLLLKKIPGIRCVIP